MREIEHLSRLYVAYLFVCAEETKLKSAEDLQEMQTSITQLQENMRQNEAKVKELSAEIQELERRRDKVSRVTLICVLKQFFFTPACTHSGSVM